MNGNAAIECKGLSKRYGRIEALKPLDLSVPAGSVFGFLGRNGAGKTTTIRLLTGLAKPTTGTAWIAGAKSTDGSDGAKANFGYLPEEPAFYNWMTPLEFLDYIGQLLALEKADRRRMANDLLELTSLNDVSSRRIGGFSRGMRQRLGIAQALLHRPPVLFLDEPTSALDPGGRKDVLNLIEQLSGETTVFLSSHILADVERVCDTIGIINKGELLLTSERDELLSQYAADTVILEFETLELPINESILLEFKKQTWITSVGEEGTVLRLTINDTAIAKRELLPLVVSLDLVLIRYEWVRPNLEDVFLTISGADSEVSLTEDR